MAGARSFEIDFRGSADRFIAIRDRHQWSLALGFVRHDGVPQAFHNPLDVLFQAQLTVVAVLEVHLTAHVVVHVPEYLWEQLMARLEGQHTPAAVLPVGASHRQLVYDETRDLELDGLQVRFPIVFLAVLLDELERTAVRRRAALLVPDRRPNKRGGRFPVWLYVQHGHSVDIAADHVLP